MIAAQTVAGILLEAESFFVSAVLTPESQRLLLKRVPPIHSKVYAHHVTLAFKPEAEALFRYRRMESQHLRIPVVAMAADDKAQAVLVGAESENEYAHITISVAEGVKPVYSNELLASADLQHIPIFTVEADVVIEPLEESSLRSSAAEHPVGIGEAAGAAPAAGSIFID